MKMYSYYHLTSHIFNFALVPTRIKQYKFTYILS